MELQIFNPEYMSTPKMAEIVTSNDLKLLRDNNVYDTEAQLLFPEIIKARIQAYIQTNRLRGGGQILDQSMLKRIANSFQFPQSVVLMYTKARLIDFITSLRDVYLNNFVAPFGRWFEWCRSNPLLITDTSTWEALTANFKINFRKPEKSPYSPEEYTEVFGSFLGSVQKVVVKYVESPKSLFPNSKPIWLLDYEKNKRSSISKRKAIKQGSPRKAITYYSSSDDDDD